VHFFSGITRFDFDKEGKHTLVYYNLTEHLDENFDAIFGTNGVALSNSPSNSP